MRNETRRAVTEYLSRLASLNGVADASQKFTVSPTVQQRLMEKVRSLGRE